MEKQLNAIALAYEAALEPNKWPEALDLIAKIGQSKGVCLGIVETSGNGLKNFKGISSSYPPEEFKDFSETHIEYETGFWMDSISFMKKSPEFTVISDNQLMGDDVIFENIPSYVDFSKRFGAFRRLGVMLNKNAPWDDAMGLQYDTKLNDFPKHACRNITALAPYLSRAVSIIRPIQALNHNHGMMLDVLDKLAIGVAVVSSDGTLILKNISFEKILDLNVLYLDPRKRLRADNGEMDSKLRRSIEATSKTSIAVDLDRGEFISLPLNDSIHPISLEVSPLGCRGKDSPGDGWSIIFAIDPQWRLVTDTKKLAQSYSLTTAEKEVCSLLLEGLSNREIADARSSGIETVKFHVSNLLAKTWTTNRTELARLAATTELPLVD